MATQSEPVRGAHTVSTEDNYINSNHTTTIESDTPDTLRRTGLFALDKQSAPEFSGILGEIMRPINLDNNSSIGNTMFETYWERYWLAMGEEDQYEFTIWHVLTQCVDQNFFNKGEMGCVQSCLPNTEAVILDITDTTPLEYLLHEIVTQSLKSDLSAAITLATTQNTTATHALTPTIFQ